MVFGLHFSGAGLDPVKSNTNGKYKVKFVREIGSGSYAKGKVYNIIFYLFMRASLREIKNFQLVKNFCLKLTEQVKAGMVRKFPSKNSQS